MMIEANSRTAAIDKMSLYQFNQFNVNQAYLLTLYTCKVSAGFPSPADDHIDGKLDLNEHLIKHPTATFFVRARGNSMIDAGIFDNDILIVDRSIVPVHGKIVIAVINGEMTVKRLYRKSGRIMLLAENSDYVPIIINDENELVIWGVVIYVIHHV